VPRLRPLTGLPLPGDVVLITKQASVQFAVVPAFWFVVYRVEPPLAFPDMCWIHGAVLDTIGEATERRSLYVRQRGLLISADTTMPGPRTASRSHRRPQHGPTDTTQRGPADDADGSLTQRTPH
jgi:hypothetical protein